MSRLLFCFTLLAACLFSAPAKPDKADKPADKAAPKTSALDKPTFEAYVRHLNVWGPQIKVDIADPKPSEMPGFSEVKVHASSGSASADFQYYVSKDGQKVVQGNVYDIAQNPFKTDLDKLKMDLQPSFGTPGAPVVLVEFSDFECPMCKEEAKMLRDNILSTYPTQVRFYFQEFPLDQLHPWARAAAIAGRCVFRQNANAFWDFHDWIFAHQDEIKPENLKDKVLEFAKDKKLDALQLTRCMDNKETETEVNKSIEKGKEVGVGATPTLFINGRRLVGRADWPTLRSIIDYEIDYQKVAHNAGENCGCEVTLPAPKLN
jgi:protein-disulfide isomerase